MTSSYSNHAQSALHNKLRFGCLRFFGQRFSRSTRTPFYHPMGQLMVFGDSPVVIKQCNREYETEIET